jgi:phosphate transport system ATP-binding protein
MNFPVPPPSTAPASTQVSIEDPILQVEQVAIAYKDRLAVADVSLDIPARQLTTFIGPSGCGKSSLLNCFNRINDLVPHAQVTGRILFKGEPIHQMPEIVLRRQIGMVFQRPNPFPKSIYENIALGLRINGYRGNQDDRVEESLRLVGLWEDVKDRLRQNATELSGGQQQRLCIARAIALGSEVLLMDEPCASLDPISTGIINSLLNDLKQYYTIIIVTHDLKQAAVVSDHVAFFNLLPYQGRLVGRLVEYGAVPDIFVKPAHQATWDYVYHQALSSMVPGTHQQHWQSTP